MRVPREIGAFLARFGARECWQTQKEDQRRKIYGVIGIFNFAIAKRYADSNHCARLDLRRATHVPVALSMQLKTSAILIRQ